MHQIETFAQMLERYLNAQKKADAVGYGNEHDAYGCSDSYATIHAEGIYDTLRSQYPQELEEYESETLIANSVRYDELEGGESYV
jgi:hypothetical protein